MNKHSSTNMEKVVIVTEFIKFRTILYFKWQLIYQEGFLLGFLDYETMHFPFVIIANSEVGKHISGGKMLQEG